jgi:DNA-binding SARP family transcriptional activator
MIVELLGELAILTPEEEIIISSAKIRLLAAYLFYHQGQWTSRRTLSGMLWGDFSESRAAASLRTALHSLLKLFRSAGLPGDIVEVRRDAVRISHGVDLYVDAHDFAAKASYGLREARDIKSLAAAAALYKGHFLEDMDSDWCLAERRRLNDLHIEVLRALVERHTQGELYDSAVYYANRWAEDDPLDEAPHQALMRLYAGRHQPHKVAEQFERCRDVLEAELGLAPSQGTVDLYEELGSPRTTRACDTLPQRDPARRARPLKRQLKRLSTDPFCNARMLLVFGEDQLAGGRVKEGLKALEKGLSIYRRRGNSGDVARAQLAIGKALLYASVDPAPNKALRHVSAALTYYRAAGQPAQLCRALGVAADACWEVGRYTDAADLAAEGLGVARAVNDQDIEGHLYLMLGLAYRDQHRLSQSEAAFRKARRAAASLPPRDLPRLFYEHAVLSLVIGDLSQAESFLREAMNVGTVVAPSTQAKLFTRLSQLTLNYVAVIQGKQPPARGVVAEDESGIPPHFAYLFPMFTPAIDSVGFGEIQAWLRAGPPVSRPYYTPPFVAVMIEQMMTAGLLREASRWTAVGIRSARTRDFGGWAAKFYSHRAVISAKLGRRREAELCCRRARELADAAERWVPAWTAWAEGLIHRHDGDYGRAKEALHNSIDLFGEIGHRYRARHVRADLEGVEMSPIPAECDYAG